MADDDIIIEPPFDPDESDPDQALRDAVDDLFDPVETDEVFEVTDVLPPLGRSWYFDFAAGRFYIQPRRGPLSSYGIDTLRGWVEKCLRTARGVHPVHPDLYGIDDPFELIGQPWEEAMVGELRTKVEDALTVHPLISSVEDFLATYVSPEDSIVISFRLELEGGGELDFPQVALTPAVP